MEKLNFVKLEINKPVKGIIKGFGRTQYGPFLLINTDENVDVCIDLSPVVLRNIIKYNKSEIKVGNEIQITKKEKPKGKRYYLYSVKVNKKDLYSSGLSLFDRIDGLDELFL